MSFSLFYNKYFSEGCGHINNDADLINANDNIKEIYIPSTCINNCIGISKFIKNCLFECCSISMQIPLTQLYLAVGCSDYTLLFTLPNQTKGKFTQNVVDNRFLALAS